jgi:hypothetical protein
MEFGIRARINSYTYRRSLVLFYPSNVTALSREIFKSYFVNFSKNGLPHKKFGLDVNYRLHYYLYMFYLQHFSMYRVFNKQ